MDPSRKKELVNAYKQKEKEGGVYCIRCTKTGKQWIDCTQDLAGMKNRLDFCILTNTAIHHALQADWNTQGASSFVFEVLEAAVPKEGQTSQDYQRDLELLRDLFREECPPEKRYP